MEKKGGFLISQSFPSGISITFFLVLLPDTAVVLDDIIPATTSPAPIAASPIPAINWIWFPVLLWIASKSLQFCFEFSMRHPDGGRRTAPNDGYVAHRMAAFSCAVGVVWEAPGAVEYCWETFGFHSAGGMEGNPSLFKVYKYPVPLGGFGLQVRQLYAEQDQSLQPVKLKSFLTIASFVHRADRGF